MCVVCNISWARGRQRFTGGGTSIHSVITLYRFRRRLQKRKVSVVTKAVELGAADASRSSSQSELAFTTFLPCERQLLSLLVWTTVAANNLT